MAALIDGVWMAIIKRVGMDGSAFGVRLDGNHHGCG